MFPHAFRKIKKEMRKRLTMIESLLPGIAWYFIRERVAMFRYHGIGPFSVRYYGILRESIRYYGISSPAGDGKLPNNLTVFWYLTINPTKTFSFSYVTVLDFLRLKGQDLNT